MIIELLHGLTKFKNTLIKPYFINNQESLLDSPASTQVSLVEAPPRETVSPKTTQTKTSPADIIPIKSVAKLPLATLASLALVKQGHGQLRKYLDQTNISALSDI